jgi:hypothetical protein
MEIVQQRGIVGKMPKVGMSHSKLAPRLDSDSKVKIAAIRDEIEQNKLRRLAKQVSKQNPTAKVKVVGRFLEVQKQGDKGRWLKKEKI